jgi:hypothetical protein
VPSTVPPGKHVVVARRGQTEYLYPVEVRNPDYGKPMKDPAMEALQAKWSAQKPKYASLRRVGTDPAERDKSCPEENLIPAIVSDNTLFSKHREGGRMESNAGTESMICLGQYILFDKPVVDLLKFDLSGIPKDTKILGAQIRLTLINTQFTKTEAKAAISAYAVRRPWNETPQTNGFSCWMGPRCTTKVVLLPGGSNRIDITSGEAWGAPACEDTEKDRFAEPAGIADVKNFPGKLNPEDKDPNPFIEARRVVALDVTGLVQKWHSGQLPNNGVLLKLDSGSLDVASSEFVEDRSIFRPTLVVAYQGADPKPAITLRPEEDFQKLRDEAVATKKLLLVFFSSKSNAACADARNLVFSNQGPRNEGIRYILERRFKRVDLSIDYFKKEAKELSVTETPTMVLLQADGKTVVSVLKGETLLDPGKLQAALDAAAK